MDRTTTKYTGKQPMAVDIEAMPETPHRASYHRRAHSDTSFRFDDLLLSDPSDFDLSSLDLPPLRPFSVDSPSFSDTSTSAGAPASRPKPIAHHFRSLSVDSDFFDGLGLAAGDDGKEVPVAVPGEKRAFHRHSSSMDGSSSFELESLMVDKSMAPDRLAELSLIDPKRAKRILANRQSAARSKERKVRYTSELERKVQTLQTEATTLSAQVTMLQRDTSGLTTENKELKMRLQALEQQAHLRNALNEALREEVQRLKIASGQVLAVNGSPFNRGMAPQFSSHHFGSQHPQQQQQMQQQQQQQMQQQQQHQMQQQQQQQMQQQQQQQSTNNQNLNGQPHPNFTTFGQRV